MTIDDVIKLVNAGFKADQIAQMYAAEKIDPPATTPSNTSPDNLRSNLSPLPGEPTPPITQEAQQTPLSVPAESPKVEEAPTDNNTELEELKKELEKSKEQVASLQGIVSGMNVAGKKEQTADEYLHNIFKDFY